VEFFMTDSKYPHASPDFARHRRDLTPNLQAAFEAFGKAAFADGALSSKMKQIVAVAVAHVTQCPLCIKGHTNAAVRAGATPRLDNTGSIAGNKN
jgi:AhpD family alkylhydroperoxidase